MVNIVDRLMDNFFVFVVNQEVRLVWLVGLILNGQYVHYHLLYTDRQGPNRMACQSGTPTSTHKEVDEVKK